MKESPGRGTPRKMLAVNRLHKSTVLAVVGVMILLAHCGAQIAHAQPTVRFLTTGELFARLDDARPEVRESARHYIMGVVDALVFARDPEICVGPQTRLDDLVGTVQKRLAARPDLLRYNAASVVRQIVASSLRCS